LLEEFIFELLFHCIFQKKFPSNDLKLYMFLIIYICRPLKTFQEKKLFATFEQNIFFKNACQNLDL
jgi:hypothetical protein